ncbi:MAG: GIY-YIG nuclease family protein [Bacteroidota bacterium]|nr:GIY-YIG nuclease family protein [Bacteroidota bacterium]
MPKNGYVYILSNKNRTTFYIGVTNNLQRRVLEHRSGSGKFTSKYILTDLIYYEMIPDIGLAIKREKQLKGWNRSWKIDLIKTVNPLMKDLFETGLD